MKASQLAYLSTYRKKRNAVMHSALVEDWLLTVRSHKGNFEIHAHARRNPL